MLQPLASLRPGMFLVRFFVFLVRKSVAVSVGIAPALDLRIANEETGSLSVFPSLRDLRHHESDKILSRHVRLALNEDVHKTSTSEEKSDTLSAFGFLLLEIICHLSVALLLLRRRPRRDEDQWRCVRGRTLSFPHFDLAQSGQLFLRAEDSLPHAVLVLEQVGGQIPPKEA